MNKALKTQFAHVLWNKYFAALVHNLLKIAPPDITFTKFWVECISIFGTRSKKAAKTTVSTSTVKGEISKADQPDKSVNLLHREKKKEKIQAQTSDRVAKEGN